MDDEIDEITLNDHNDNNDNNNNKITIRNVVSPRNVYMYPNGDVYEGIELLNY